MNNAGNNVANAATPGFARRRVEFQGLPDQQLGNAAYGLGVEVTSVRRLTDPFLDFAARREMSRYGGDSQRASMLQQLEPLMGPVDGAPLASSLSDLFDAWGSLASGQADDVTARSEVIGAAENLASTIRRLDDGLYTERTAANARVEESVTRINEISARLAEINKQIVPLEAGRSEAGQLRDERGLLLDELSDLVAVRSIEHDNGQISVFLSVTGDTLLDHGTARPLRLAEDSDGMSRVLANRGGAREDITELLRSGRLGGALAVRDETLVDLRSRLDTFAATVIERFNARHRIGFDLDGNVGQALFTPDPPGASAASSIAVNAAVAGDPNKIAAAGNPGAPGDNANALAFDTLRQQSLVPLGGVSLNAFVSDLVAGVGRDTATAFVQREASEAIVLSFQERRQAVSGVSLDEEAAMLAQWQQTFQASARFMETVNRVTDIAMNLLSR
jgi:flagellar hook-associated protein 1 FlgK